MYLHNSRQMDISREYRRTYISYLPTYLPIVHIVLPISVSIPIPILSLSLSLSISLALSPSLAPFSICLLALAFDTVLICTIPPGITLSVYDPRITTRSRLDETNHLTQPTYPSLSRITYIQP
ncbi:hypothetical protein GGS23DRAFT_20287 [Durotheca rogersii]|uniref:uncharacterized protein n=1 Tax=Durotheca rogersii TaxID=419775 RepID=UPI00221F6A86|nr:uncharacterized protein GGS23DRAFT_20287 [Durotheca rogersii]KAI5868277.1 hypothetical protein GGS23DRAFT_20287 [Durotheca rogersii]